MADGRKSNQGRPSANRQLPAQAQAPGPPSNPPKRSRSWGVLLRGLDFVKRCIRLVVVGLPLWLFGKREPVLAWVFRGFTLLSVGYLIYDRYYETDAVITAPISDPADPFFYPFSLTNSSHILPIKNVDWGCRLVDVRYEGNSSITNSSTITGRKAYLHPGGTANIYCNKNFIKVDKSMISAKIQMQAEYDVSVFGLYTWRRTSALTTFTWMSGPTESRRQWIRGDL